MAGGTGRRGHVPRLAMGAEIGKQGEGHGLLRVAREEEIIEAMKCPPFLAQPLDQRLPQDRMMATSAVCDHFHARRSKAPDLYGNACRGELDSRGASGCALTAAREGLTLTV